MSSPFRGSQLTSKLSRRFYRIEGLQDQTLGQGAFVDQLNPFCFEIAWEVCNKGKYIFLIYLSFRGFDFDRC